jgi:hypothetical protein
MTDPDPQPRRTASNCAPARRLISFLVMIDTSRQLPAPTADAWSIDLTALGGPLFVVLTTSEAHARERLVEHLVELGKVEDIGAGTMLLAEIPAERVAVIW